MGIFGDFIRKVWLLAAGFSGGDGGEVGGELVGRICGDFELEEGEEGAGEVGGRLGAAVDDSEGCDRDGAVLANNFDRFE